MKKLILLLVVTLTSFILFTACDNSKTSSSKDTPVIVGTELIGGESVRGFGLKEAKEVADVIAEVEITEWVGETDIDSFPITTFKAKILKTHKNIIDSRMKDPYI